MEKLTLTFRQSFKEKRTAPSLTSLQGYVSQRVWLLARQGFSTVLPGAWAPSAFRGAIAEEEKEGGRRSSSRGPAALRKHNNLFCN